MSATEVPTTRKKVFVLEDHPTTRIGLIQVVNWESDLEVCGEWDQAPGALEAIQDRNPDAILMDLRLKDEIGIDLIKQLREAGVTAPILVISGCEEDYYARRVLNAGANGFLMKQEAASSVVDGLRRVLAGDIYLSQSMVQKHLNVLSPGGTKGAGGLALNLLTDREFEIFSLLGDGRSSAQIGDQLGISSKTVDAHRANIKEKLGLASGREVIRRAAQWQASGGGRQ